VRKKKKKSPTHNIFVTSLWHETLDNESRTFAHSLLPVEW